MSIDDVSRKPTDLLLGNNIPLSAAVEAELLWARPERFAKALGKITGARVSAAACNQRHGRISGEELAPGLLQATTVDQCRKCESKFVTYHVSAAR